MLDHGIERVASTGRLIENELGRLECVAMKEDWSCEGTDIRVAAYKEGAIYTE